MRILHVTDAAAAGVLASVTALAREQAADPSVDEVRFGYTPRPDSPAHESIVAGMGEGVDVLRWSTTPRTALPGLMRGLLRELRRDEADVIHLHSSRAGFLGRLIASVTPPKAHIVYSPHGFAFNRTDFTDLQGSMFLRLERWALHGGTDLILVSDSEAALASAKLPQARTAVLPNVVDTAKFSPPAVDAPAQSAILNIVHLGRISAQKQPELFTEIAARANSAHPGRFSFTWIGEGDRQLLQSNGQGNAEVEIEITGWLDAERIRVQLSQASVLLFTSFGEGMPISLLEAGSMGIPAVGSDVVGVRDLITEGANGFLFRTVAEAVAALERLLDTDVRTELGAAARTVAVNEHCRTGLAERSLAVYRSFLATTAATTATDTTAPSVNTHPVEHMSTDDAESRS